MAVGDGGEDGDKDRVNGIGAEYSLKCMCSVGVVIWERDLCGDRVHAKITRWITSSSSEKGCRDDGAAYNDQRLRVAPDN